MHLTLAKVLIAAGAVWVLGLYYAVSWFLARGAKLDRVEGGRD